MAVPDQIAAARDVLEQILVLGPAYLAQPCFVSLYGVLPRQGHVSALFATGIWDGTGLKQVTPRHHVQVLTGELSARRWRYYPYAVLCRTDPVGRMGIEYVYLLPPDTVLPVVVADVEGVAQLLETEALLEGFADAYLADQ